MKRMELITPLTPILFLFICISRSAYFYALSTSRISEYIYVAFFAHFRLFICRKIPKISPGAYIFQRPFLRGLYSEGLIYGGKFACQNRLG